MNDFFSIIGSIASLISIPLAIYLYLKSKEAKFDKLKKDISRVLSYQIGDERQLSTFEIKTVISSKLRENRINTDAISVSEVIEDLVSETISSPLISKERKTQILDNLKRLYVKGEFFDELETLSTNDKVTWENIEPKVKVILQQRIKLNEKVEETKSKTEIYKQRMSTVFAITAFLVTTLTLVIALLGKDKFIEWNNKVEAPFKENEFLITIIMGAVTSLLSGLSMIIFKKKKDK
ncbi:hypothetical protein Dfri01_67060 [Dyadobacter frigoris]|uniref:hypothetical protein n=1 Tax=Dyadobacter frigoris TaxID=2576211 RepID=UPI0024A1525A|nr:hypothetical protein [Dyadobacter frigoris]GLU57245.1 hypothetical protein Dfri01_67060 [Dyadobacter frigoris]